MRPSERREQARQATREQILDAARELFVANGYEAVSMRKIAERVGYSAPALYLHFTDKQALVRELCLTDFLALSQALREIAEEPDPLERLRRTGYAYVDYALAHPQHYRLMFMTPLPPPELAGLEEVQASPEEDGYEFLKRTVAECVAAGRFRSALTDVEGIAQLCWGAAHGIVSLWLVRQQDPWVEWRPVRDQARALVDATLDGLSGPASAR